MDVEEVAVTPSPFLEGGSHHPRSTPDLPDVCSKTSRNSPNRRHQRLTPSHTNYSNPSNPPKVVLGSPPTPITTTSAALVSSSASSDTSSSRSSAVAVAVAHNPPTSSAPDNNDNDNDNDNNDDDRMDASPRRSGRDRVSTCIQIDGHTVKKDNFYVVKGLGYQYGDLSKVDAPSSKKKVMTNKRKATTNNNNNEDDDDADGSTKKKKAPRVLSGLELERQEHNYAIKQRVQAKAPLRLAHLAKHLAILEPFLEDATMDALHDVAAMTTATTTTAMHPPPQDAVQSPKAIQADLRDYQLKGLQWMAKMHEKNLGMIL
jgi:hypothetical protein